MNGLHVLILATLIVGAVFVIPRLTAIDRVFAEMEALDDEQLAAILAEYPDYLTGRA